MAESQKNKRQQATQYVRNLAEQEGPVLFIYGAMFSGAMSFLYMTSKTNALHIEGWIWIALIVSIIGLPKAFKRLNGKNLPYMIRFAMAFKEGFLSLSLLAPDLGNWLSKVRKLWQRFR